MARRRHNLVDMDMDGNDDSADGIGFGVDAGLHNKQEDLGNDTVELTAQVSTFMNHHARENAW